MPYRWGTSGSMLCSQRRPHGVSSQRNGAFQARLGQSVALFLASPLFSLQQRNCAAVSPTGSKGISMDTVWSLWNEGNLFSLSQDDLVTFLKAQKVEITGQEKKTELVRKVEEVMSSTQPTLVQQEESAISLFDQDSANAGTGDLFEEADVYGDWGVDPSFEEKSKMDFMEKAVDAQGGDSQNPLDVRATQLLHETQTSDVRVVPLNPSEVPASAAGRTFYTLEKANVAESNRERFSRACLWAVNNMWNLGQEGDINVTFGRTLLKNIINAVLFKKTVVPLWSAQKAMMQPQVLRFVALAHENNTEDVAKFLKENGFASEKEPTTSYLVMIKRPRDPVVLELNSELQPVEVLRAWDRHLVSQFIRKKMPDVRFIVRGRSILKKRIATPYLEAEVLKFKNDTVESVLAPELGDVQYVAERVIASWVKQDVASGTTIRMIQTKRTPVLTTNTSNQGERLEYELTMSIPPKDTANVLAMANSIYELSHIFSRSLEPGMGVFKAEAVVDMEL